jgi:superfamily I DNA/RNA helicase
MKKLTEYLERKGINIDSSQKWAKDMLPFLRKIAINQEISNRLANELDKVRKNKKLNYWMNSGKIKLSTIHSFKVWEVDTLFLIIEAEQKTFTTDELIYTALTRCRNNLFILDCGKSRYASFFNTALR